MPPHSFFLNTLKRKFTDGLSSCLLVFALLLWPNLGVAQERPAYLVKSAMIFRMLQYTTWPDEDKLSVVRVAFVGDEDDLYDELLKAAKTIKVKGKPLIVFKTDIDSIDPRSNQVVYLSASHSESLYQVATNIRRTDTLLISNQAQSQHDLMINFLSLSGKAISFEINRSNIIFEKLAINRDLLLLGGTEIDVAELFRETEMALQQIKLNLFENQTQLKETSRTLAQEQQQIQHQKTQIKQQQQQIGEQERQLGVRSQQLNKLNSDVQQTSKDLQSKQTQLATREKRNSEQLNRLRDQGVKVAFLNEQIVEKQAFLAAKQEELESLAGKNDEQEGAIISQQKILAYALSVLFVLVGLIVFSLWVNASRKRTNRQLQQTQANMVTLGGIGRDLTANLDLNQVIEQVYQSLNKVLDAHIFLLGILEKDKNRLHVPLIVEERERIPTVDFDLNDETKPAVLCVNQQKEVIINNAEQWYEHFTHDIPEPKKGKKMVTVVYFPLVISDKIVGCLSLQSPEPNAYSEEQLDMIRILSRYTAIAVTNALGYTELEQQKRKTEEQNREIIAAQQQLVQSEKMASLGMLTSGVAHEINDPASFTHTATYMMEKEVAKIKLFLKQLAGGDDADPKVLALFDDKFAKLIELSQTAQLGSKRIKGIVDNVRAFGHRDDVEQQQLPLTELIGSTVQLIRSQYSAIDITMSMPSSYSTLCYPAKLGQVFMNLTVNACESVEKRSQQQPQLAGQVCITAVTTDDKLTISVKDNGCGMCEQTQQQLFDPFFTTKTEGTGLGLGMTISLGIIKELGGSMSIESAIDDGTCISFSFVV